MTNRRSGEGVEMVTLRGGLDLPLAALQLAWRLEEDGVEMRVDGDALVVCPARLVADGDVQLLRKYRAELKRLVQYQPPEMEM